MTLRPLAHEQKTTPCDICDGPVPEPGYGESNCPTCGQLYSYDESVMMVLTAEQYEVLREHYKKNPERKAQYAAEVESG